MTEQTNKKLMLDESPAIPLQFKLRKFGCAIFTATQTMEHIKEGRKLGPTPAGMLPQEEWLNRLIAMEETLPRGKFFDRFRCCDKSEQYDLAAQHLRIVGQKKR
ncbi:hypothetical protein P0E94_002351 [Vibrio metschnikovii]|nr:hypothetical protein [Vibrio metschnikovii]HDZ9205416.1 hypothetical protein [Vibrio cholerae]